MKAFFSNLLFGSVRFLVAVHYGNQIREWIRIAEGSGRPGEEKKEMVLKRIRIYLNAVGLSALWDWNMEFWTNLIETEFEALVETGDLSPVPLSIKFSAKTVVKDAISAYGKTPQMKTYVQSMKGKSRAELLKELERLSKEPWSVETAAKVQAIIGILR